MTLEDNIGNYKKKTKADLIHELQIKLRDERMQNTFLAQKLSANADTIGRLENDLSDGVKILETIWIAFDRDYLMKYLLAADYEKLKDYLGK